MIRPLVVIICVFCVATIISEILGLSYLWVRGHLNADSVKDIRMIVTGQSLDDVELVEEETSLPSRDEVAETRAMRILELAAREDEIELLKSSITESSDFLKKERLVFEEAKKKFEEELKILKEKSQNVATKKTQSVLVALPSGDAVQYLMQLSIEENIELIKGMDGKFIAKLLKEFLVAPDPLVIKRGKEIFKEISQDEPFRSFSDGALDKLSQNN
ncbi:hypothetical protein [Gimesia maris]|jgi:hypothetical protein|uniref:Flagellar protein FlbB n=1 Tax=Gimesia maris TaxID=122 RepID=A0A3D3RBN0_9PLAN|nr:hypothetical protein [Gimesia maris]MAC51357.1 hypothetical protein [Gimesia sp.]QDT78754.1 hypothetical protein Mal35_22040 [Gimesia maris]HAW28700.1 hypothetical protein [Planctomycetaceae bacterium]HCO25518.1 hypothetical protein [Gimesia maris]|tara:strand:+ start:79647 stop:80297 length:651 start_codon:yes stop_codon:yes gene_type:complete